MDIVNNIITLIDTYHQKTYVVDDSTDEHFVLDITNGSYTILTYWSINSSVRLGAMVSKSAYPFDDESKKDEKARLTKYLENKFNIKVDYIT